MNLIHFTSVTLLLLHSLSANAAEPIKLSLARGEYALQQLAHKSPLQAASLTLPTDRIKLTAYRLGTISSGKTEIPDIAIPLELAKSPRFHLLAQNTPKKPESLLELYVEKDCPPGTYSGSLNLDYGKEKQTIAVTVKVFKYTLPSHFSLKTSFGFAPWGTLKRHFGKWVEQEQALYSKYFALASEHRIDLHKIYSAFPKTIGPGMLSDFDAQLTRLNWNVTDLPVPDSQKAKPEESYWKTLDAEVVSRGLREKTFVYFADEPKDAAIPALKAALQKIHAWAPNVRILVTRHFTPALDGLVQIWCPNLIQWDQPGFPKPAFYKNRKGEELWVYVSCNSHGCGTHENPGIPDMTLEHDATSVRAFPWVANLVGATGILYYDTVYGYYQNKPLSPWKDLNSFGGKGEGNLFYPCTQAQCGVEAPLASLRLKILRDGLEDVEILKTSAIPQDIISTVRSAPKSLLEFERVKTQALEKLEF